MNKLTTLIGICVLMSCTEYIMAPLPKDYPIIDTDTIPDIPVDTIPVDTITPPVDSIIQDTCEEYEQIELPAFISFFINKDVFIQPLTWYYDTDPIDIDSFFGTIGTHHEIYYSGVNIGGVVDGTNDHVSLSHHIRIRDGSGAIHALSFGRQSWYFRGALTFSQAMEVLEERPSARFINFSNTGYNCEQIAEVLHFLLEDCKGGISGLSIVDLRTVDPACIDPEIVAELELRDWIVWM